MPPNLPPNDLRHANAMLSAPRNKLEQYVSRQGLETGTEGKEGPEGKEGKPAKVGTPEAAVSRAVNEAHTVPAYVTTVYLTLKLKAEKTAWNVLVAGKAVFADTAETLPTGTLTKTYTLRAGESATWEVKMNEGEAAELHSVYAEG